MKPTVDVIIAVHDESRPIERAVGSVLEHTRADVRVTVVCHGLQPAEVAQRLAAYELDQRLRLVAFDDGVRSPAGPFNAGLDAATARYTSVMGSDDELQVGAIDAWLEIAARDEADVVIARLRHAAGSFVATPPTRPLRRSRLDAVRDRLSYRSAPLGLVSRSRFGELRFTTGVPTGEDIAYVTALWFSRARISYAIGHPAYLVHDDAVLRASSSPRDIALDLAFLPRLISAPETSALDETSKRTLAVKLWRINVFGTIHNRRESPFSVEERRTLAALCEQLVEFSPQALGDLSIADHRLVKAARAVEISGDELSAFSDGRRRFARPASMLSWRISNVFAREAPIRMMAATLAQRLRRN